MKLLKTTIFFLILSGLTLSQTTYLWTGSINSNFSAAGNWSPVRQIGLTTDILVFENGGNLNVINVNQVTIGQLKIRNNTSLTLSPSAGNSKTITIKGAAGEDFEVESGSSLKISGNDPQLNLYLSSGATASINGSVSFQGSIAHNINAVDENAVKFNSGSSLSQLCPGNMFNTTGTSNVVIFENGSSFIINHPNALSPFGIAAPNSKVSFETGSSLIIISAGTFSLNGRMLSNLVIEQGNTVNISEQFTSDFTINDINVKSGAQLNITNTNPNFIAKLNIQGNINVEGSLKFNAQASNPINVILNGSQPQSISGNGEILIPKTLNKFTISNDIILHRDLYVSCNLAYYAGTITYNGYRIYSSRKRLTLDNQDTAPEEKLTENKQLNNTLNSSLPNNFSLSQNYPNPFNPSTKINYTLPKDSKVTIKVFDITGKEVAVLVDNDVKAGYHTVDFNSGSLSSGVYFYTINADGYNKTLKMILAK
jgi:hypothetical protein